METADQSIQPGDGGFGLGKTGQRIVIGKTNQQRIRLDTIAIVNEHLCNSPRNHRTKVRLPALDDPP